MSELRVVDHPLIQHKLTLMRRTECHTWEFRRLLREISMLLAYEVTRDLPTRPIRIRTPLEEMEAVEADEHELVLVSILRAGLGLLDGMLEILPAARVGHVGLYRDEETLEAREYYCKLPPEMEKRHVILLDPMLATGGSAIAATERLREVEPLSIRFVCLLAAPEGIENYHAAHPDVPIVTAAVDRQLNEKGYILPGLGDAGDRLYGTS